MAKTSKSVLGGGGSIKTTSIALGDGSNTQGRGGPESARRRSAACGLPDQKGEPFAQGERQDVPLSMIPGLTRP